MAVTKKKESKVAAMPGKAKKPERKKKKGISAQLRATRLTPEEVKRAVSTLPPRDPAKKFDDPNSAEAKRYLAKYRQRRTDRNNRLLNAALAKKRMEVRKDIIAKLPKKSKTRKVYYRLRFRRPRTQKTIPDPRKNPRRVFSRATPKMDRFSILKVPLNTESAMKKMEDHNTLVFSCHLRATKPQIKRAVKQSYGVEVQKVNTLITPQGKKKAYIRLPADVEAMDVANKIGLL